MRMNIYVPDEMKARMDGAGQAVNWSAIAQRAFEVELNRLESIKEIKSMSNVIERLRASKARSMEEHAEQGRAVGIQWAKEFAEYDELSRLVKLPESCGADWERIFDQSQWVARDLYYAITGRAEESAERHEILAFFEKLGVSNDDIAPAWATAFVEGAGDVWDEVCDQI